MMPGSAVTFAVYASVRVGRVEFFSATVSWLFAEVMKFRNFSDASWWALSEPA